MGCRQGPEEVVLGPEGVVLGEWQLRPGEPGKDPVDRTVHLTGGYPAEPTILK